MTGDRSRKRFPLLAPSWVVRQIERNKLPSSTLLNLDKLLEICSLEDIVVMYCLNTEPAYIDRVFGPGAPIALPGLTEYWGRHYSAQLARVLELVGLYRGVLEERLFCEADPSASVHPSNPQIAHIESEDLSVSAIVIVLKPGQLGGTDQRKAQLCIIREYMRQLYVFTDYATLARDPLFERYLKSVTLVDVSEPA
jgi:hypothetical protein